MGVMMLYSTNLSRSDAVVINVAGRQRMLTQKMIQKSLAIYFHTDFTLQSETIAELNQARLEFEKAHIGLRNGDSDLGIPGTDDNNVLKNWNAVDEYYSNNFKQLIINIENSQGNVSETMISSVITEEEPLIERLQSMVLSFQQFAENKIAFADLLAIIFPFGIFAISIFAGFMLNYTISRPLIRISDDSKAIADGDLTILIDSNQQNRKDEIGVLSKNFGLMVINLKKAVTDIQKGSTTIATNSQEMASSAEEVNATSEEISSITQQMSRGSQEQSVKSSESTMLVEELQKSFSEKIKNIEELSGLIEDITGKVNMLALNASIEAARAGEYGRGFAVVAENIRQLAEEGKKSVSKVNEITSDIQTYLQSSIKTIYGSIQEVASISEETASGAEEATAATEEQTATMQEMSSSAQELANIASDLENAVKKFTI
ncbi:MAG: Methyl-accepting chemotaxis protein McpC [Candidatus Heimdallarchaeota archaeon LC_3]|nr:MAG: Methyl-accepting chemotaxis protein McpC [Candidatus Heimdallarchaeota archaeon LC_3]